LDIYRQDNGVSEGEALHAIRGSQSTLNKHINVAEMEEEKVRTVGGHGGVPESEIGGILGQRKPPATESVNQAGFSVQRQEHIMRCGKLYLVSKF